MISAQTPLAAFRLDGKVAVITGGASGIGRATAELFASVGAHVVIADRDADAAQAALEAIVARGGNGESVAIDVGDEAVIDAALAGVAARHGGVDILVANAGTNIRKPSVEIALSEWEKVVSVNMTGAFLCARAAARHMIAAKCGGAIVITASIMSFSGGGLYPNVAYQTTKGALVNMTRALAVEWAREGIRVNAVAPTWVRTPFIATLLANNELMTRVAELTPLGRIAEPEEVANAMLFLASPAAAMVTGHTLLVDGGFMAQ
jgi:NAD(P)-dependent dehydrogenase (short-subunit alcohol dehydrogenase family)